MDHLTKARKVTRTSITKTTNKINEELNKNNPDQIILRVLRDDISRLMTNVEAQDQGVFNIMLDENRTEEELNLENDETTVYRDKLSLAIILIDDCLKIVNGDNISIHTINTPPNDNDNSQTRKLYKLPKIEISKFDGELLNWLIFWSQFEKIHNDKQLHNSDKFQYLSQSMQENSRAKELVKSYPQTADNYPKVITALTERFGKKKVLKQVYVRELIKMVVTNVNAKQKISISKLFDNLESHLRALESLAVTVEQMSEFLFPLVESSLPEEILIAWQRSANFGKDGTTEVPLKTELDYLMLFLKQEVESEQQRNLARVGFSTMISESHENTLHHSKEKPKIPTAASLFVSNSNSCIFCGKSHQSQDCNKAMEMSLKTREDLVKDKEACNRCLKIHNDQRCKSWVKCTGCAKPHFHIMCPDRIEISTQPVQNSTNTCNMVSNQTHMSQVLLKTIIVKIKTEFECKNVRVLFDDGSYIRSSIANEMKLLECNKYFERNTLFGGVLSNIEERIVYKVPVTSLDEKQNHILELPNKVQITGDVLKLPKGPWLQELKSKKIWINDYTSETEDIDILIGADLAPMLTTDESVTLNCGLKAIKTVFGWTIMGPLPNSSVNVTTSQIITQSQIKTNNIKDLWDSEFIRIRDPVEVKSKIKKELVKDHFKQNTDGKYKMSLPWIAVQLIQVSIEKMVIRRLALMAYDIEIRFALSWINRKNQNLPCLGYCLKESVESKWWEEPDWLKKPEGTKFKEIEIGKRRIGIGRIFEVLLTT